MTYPYGGYPAPGGEPPRRRANLTVILSVVSLVVIVGGVAAIVLLTRNRDEPPPPDTAAPPAAAEQSRPPAESTTRRTGAGDDRLRPRNAGWSVINNPRGRMIYEVPPSWTPLPGGTINTKTVTDVQLQGPAVLTEYQCQGKGYSRGGLGSGTTAKSDVNTLATRLAKALGAEFYDDAPNAQVQAGEPKPVTRQTPSGRTLNGVQVDAIITTTGHPCLASRGKISVVVLDAPGDYQVFVVNGDLAGGPAQPTPSGEAELQRIVDNMRPTD